MCTQAKREKADTKRNNVLASTKFVQWQKKPIYYIKKKLKDMRFADEFQSYLLLVNFNQGISFRTLKVLFQYTAQGSQPRWQKTRQTTKFPLNVPILFGADNMGEEAVKGPFDENENTSILVSNFPFQLTFQAGVGQRSKGENQTLWDKVKRGVGKAETE